MFTYCDKCEKEVNTERISKKQNFKVLGEEIVVEAPVMICEECGEELFNEELDSKAIVSAYEQYRKKHKLLFPNEIKQIREQYNLSQRAFSKLLNWGDKTVFRYENGAIQDKAHNSLLVFLKDPANMKQYLLENEITLSDKQKIKLFNLVDNFEKNNNYCDENLVFSYFFSQTPCIENGFKGFDYDKFCAMVLFFLSKHKELLKTKLMKLLNYSDMVFYKENGISISGLKYIHLPYGPAPDNFDILLTKMSSDCIAHVEVLYENNYEKHQIVADCDLPDGALSKQEIDLLERVFEKFKGFGSKEISNYSHKEKGYSSTSQGDTISYDYAKYIEID